jgi:hypothetical protein
MLTRQQWTLVALWIGAPLLFFLVLLLINPGYMAGSFQSLGPLSSLGIMVFLQVVNLICLYFGFSAINQRTAARPRTRLWTWLLAAVTLILFTLPSMWIALIYPSMMQVIRGGGSFAP